MKIIFKATIIISIVIVLIGCKDDKPVNLTTAREEVKEYYESGKFNEELTGVIKDAKEKFNSIEVKENSVVIFDVDETVLDNYELAKLMGFGYVYKMNKEWNSEMKAPAITGVKDFYDFLLNKGFKIIFLTGRNFPEYDATYKNLKKAGYAVFDTLITQIGDEKKMKALEFKSGKRAWLTERGYEIAGTVGDQWSDLEGKYHGIQVKIPNYLYEIK
ncbi:MAG: HAD family acid phosphatase [Ignavibacteria bacterium]|jgi:acid phosphatase